MGARGHSVRQGECEERVGRGGGWGRGGVVVCVCVYGGMGGALRCVTGPSGKC